MVVEILSVWTNQQSFVASLAENHQEINWCFVKYKFKKRCAHPLLIVNPPFVILLDHHLYPSLPVASL